MDFTIRQAEERDVLALSKILVGAWQEGFKNILTEEFLKSMSVEEWAGKKQMWLTEEQHWVFIAENEQNEPVGFIGFGKLRTPPPGMSPIRPLYSAEIYAVNILSEFWGQGLGTALIKKSAQFLFEQKHKSLCLWVMDKNKRANVLYKKLGGERCGKKESEIGGTDVREVCYGWRDSKILLDEK